MDGRDKEFQVNEFNITFEKAKKEVAKRKGRTAPAIDRILDYWWKKLEPTQKILTRLFTKMQAEKMIRRWINIACGFLQRNSYSPVAFCISEIPVCSVLQQSRRYRIGPPRSRDVSRSHSLFADDLKVCQESHEILRDVNEVIVQASHDIGACYGLSECTSKCEIVFERGKMVRGEGLEILE